MAHIILPIQPEGAILRMGIGISHERASVLAAANLAIHEPVPVLALLDSGASATCIDAGVLQQLGVAPTGSTTMHTPSTHGTPIESNQYDVAIIVFDQHGKSLVLGTVPVIESHFQGLGFDVLFGRDLMSLMLFIYDGIAGQFTLTF